MKAVDHMCAVLGCSLSDVHRILNASYFYHPLHSVPCIRTKYNRSDYYSVKFIKMVETSIEIAVCIADVTMYIPLDELVVCPSPCCHIDSFTPNISV